MFKNIVVALALIATAIHTYEAAKSEPRSEDQHNSSNTMYKLWMETDTLWTHYSTHGEEYDCYAERKLDMNATHLNMSTSYLTKFRYPKRMSEVWTFTEYSGNASMYYFVDYVNSWRQDLLYHDEKTRCAVIKHQYTNRRVKTQEGKDGGYTFYNLVRSDRFINDTVPPKCRENYEKVSRPKHIYPEYESVKHKVRYSESCKTMRKAAK
uniref:Lipocalin n=1 Tax=Rhipicephalus appendiculatus TaxID=34631 RepID=A0A131YSD4_RHIAP